MWSVVIPASLGPLPAMCVFRAPKPPSVHSAVRRPHPHSALHCYLVRSSCIGPQVQLNWSPPDGTEEPLSGSTPAHSGTRPLRELGRRGGQVCGPVTHLTLPVDSVGSGCQ